MYLKVLVNTYQQNYETDTIHNNELYRHTYSVFSILNINMITYITYIQVSSVGNISGNKQNLKQNSSNVTALQPGRVIGSHFVLVKRSHPLL